MILKDVRDYLNKLAREDPHALYNPIQARDERKGQNYDVLYIDEGQNPVEIVFRSKSPEIIDYENSRD